MATPESPAPVKNRWTRWYMWFLYSVVGFLIFIIIIALAVPGEPANVTPEERMARLEATQSAELVKATREASEQQTKTADELVEATREASEQQTKEAIEHFEEQTKEAEDLHKQQTKEAEDNTGPDKQYCSDLHGYLRGVTQGLVQIGDAIEAAQSGAATERVVIDTLDEMTAAAIIMKHSTDGVEDLDVPKDAKDLQNDAEALADDVNEYYELIIQSDLASFEQSITVYIKMSASANRLYDKVERYCEW